MSTEAIFCLCGPHFQCHSINPTLCLWCLAMGSTWELKRERGTKAGESETTAIRSTTIIVLEGEGDKTKCNQVFQSCLASLFKRTSKLDSAISSIPISILYTPIAPAALSPSIGSTRQSRPWASGRTSSVTITLHDQHLNFPFPSSISFSRLIRVSRAYLSMTISS